MTLAILIKKTVLLACVVYKKSGSSKKDYRLFNIPKKISGNDIGSLEHAISRRLKYYENKLIKPDLILIDGGKNQLKFVQNIINKITLQRYKSYIDS